MLQVARMAGITLLLGLCMPVLGYSQNAQSDRKATFLGELKGWVRDALAEADPAKARYVIRRAGCTLVVKTQKDGKFEYLAVADQTKKCGGEVSNFDCRAVLGLVDDLNLVRNKYYDYCKDRLSPAKERRSLK